MKRVNNLYGQVLSFENLMSAAKKALKGTKSKTESLEFYFNLESNLINLQNEIESEIYEPGGYKYFKVFEPKEREIAVAPFRDRVVHHAIVNVLEPIYEKIFISDSYATRKNKGTHKAVLKAQEMIKRNEWYFKSDIRKYFPSIDHDVIISILRRKIKDKRLLSLLEKVVRNGGADGKGLPIGNLTSQFLANVYLDRFDHYMKDELGFKYYVRYMDDFVVFDNQKEKLKALRPEIEEFLKSELCLDLKEKATYINKRMNGLSFLGMRVFPATVRINRINLKRSVKKMQMKAELYLEGKIKDEKMSQSAQSITGYLKYFNTYKLRCDLIAKGVLY
ncbi:MAG: reverse transcriptase/maturase family protein [Candidatus Delongbacteria bacterium]|nr:reverse transcriptase/maturase family protein [Candidatus Delongbacteria bacterium]MCG2760778.1 reverse transcriptase/maturase family protein [Candidatus Delongbacteria bacterium]